MKTGLAGKLAGAFINSKLTPLIILASLLMGGFAVLRIPREEEPQIIVPMADVIVAMPGSSAKEVETRVTAPLEKLIWEIPGVEYVYSTTTTGQSMVIVRPGPGASPSSTSRKNSKPLRPDSSWSLAANYQASLHRRCADPRANAS